MQIIAPDQPNEIPATPKHGEIIVRPSTEADAAAMIAIYTGYVTHGLNRDAPFEPMQSDDIKRRRKNMQKHRLPHLVAELDGVVIGYAYAVPFRKRPAYRYCVKHSIYVHEEPSARRRRPKAAAGPDRGLRRRRLPADDRLCRFRKSGPSLNLHEACGFRRVAYLEGIGFRFGRWTDSVMMQRALGPGGSAPPARLCPVLTASGSAT